MLDCRLTFRYAIHLKRHEFIAFILRDLFYKFLMSFCVFLIFTLLQDEFCFLFHGNLNGIFAGPLNFLNPILFTSENLLSLVNLSILALKEVLNCIITINRVVTTKIAACFCRRDDTPG